MSVALSRPEVGYTDALQADGFLDRGGNHAASSPVDMSEGFVRHFRSAAPYIALHRDSTFVVVFPGTVIQDKNAVVCCQHTVYC